MPTQINRDSFARETLVRRVVRVNAGQTCDNCGGLRTQGKWASLFEYGTEPDSISCRVNWHKGLFCSKGCHDQYHS